MSLPARLLLIILLLYPSFIFPGSAGSEVPEPVIFCGRADPTADKPQSKVWYAQGTWWAWLPWEQSGGRLWRRGSEGAWSPEEHLDPVLAALPGRADVLAGALGDTVAAVLAGDSLLAVARLAWDPASGRYGLEGEPLRWRAFPAVETATIDREAGGDFWVAYPEDAAGGRRVAVRKVVQGGGRCSLGGPVFLARGLNRDEICAVCSLGDGSAGVMWSDQDAEALFFRTHRPGAPDTAWSAAGTVAAGGKTADDHLNFCLPPSGSGLRLLAATKTSLDSVGLPLLCLRVLDSLGRWHSVPFAPLTPQGHPSRPVVIWQGGRPVCLYTLYGPEHRLLGLNPVMLQEFSADGLSPAGPPRMVMPPLRGLNNVTAPKAAPPGKACLVLASDDEGRVYEALLGP